MIEVGRNTFIVFVEHYKLTPRRYSALLILSILSPSDRDEKKADSALLILEVKIHILKFTPI